MAAQAKTVGPTSVNGINVNDLFALIDGVRRDKQLTNPWKKHDNIPL